MENLLKCAAGNRPPQAAIFLSGGGSNAEKILEFRYRTAARWLPAVIITDAPDRSRAAAIAAKYSLPFVGLDLREFYRRQGEDKISLATERGRRLRELWTAALREKIAPFKIDFGILAGFIPLSNITADFPCLNVHPGDLTVERAGRRLLVGLHAIPTELAIINGFTAIRSSVIIAQPYTGAGGEMDSGPILGVSPELELDLQGFTRDALLDIYRRRPAKKPPGGWNDALSRVAAANQERLKEKGDWIVFPQVVNDFAAGRFGQENGQLYYRQEAGWIRTGTIEYKALANS